jgi:hypothetical protein
MESNIKEVCPEKKVSEVEFLDQYKYLLEIIVRLDLPCGEGL